MWNKMMGEKVFTPFIVFLDCSEQTMLNRCLKRGETSQRTDDNEEILRKRFKTFNDETLLVINYFKGLEKLVQINSEQGVEQVFATLKEALVNKNIIQ